MIEADFFSPGELARIIVIYCTSKVENILVDYQKNELFLCSKYGYQGIYSKDKIKENYYKPLLDLRNAFNEILVEDKTINVMLSDGELIVIGCLSLDENVSSERVNKISTMLEKIRDTKYSDSEIKKYNLIIEEKIKKHSNKKKKNNNHQAKQNNQEPKIRPIFIFLFILSCIGLVYGLYNLKQLRTAQKIEYEIDGATLSTLPYKSLDAIHAQKLNIPNQCKNTNGKEEEIIQCLKSLESDVFYYKKDITNIDYDPNSQLLKFDCNFTTSSTSNNLVEIKVDDYDSKGYRPLDIQIFKVIPADEIDSFQNRLIQHGQCSYLLSGIKDVYVENNNNISSKVVVPVKLDVYIWFNDDLSIFYHEQTNNYSIYDY